MMTMKNEFAVFLLAVVLLAPTTAMAWHGGGESETKSIPQYFCQFITATSEDETGQKQEEDEEEDEEPDCD